VADAGNTLGGTLTMGAVSESSGAGTVGWTYKVADHATDYLAADQTATEKFTVTIADGHGGTVDQVVAITVAGTNEAPTITTADATGSVTEDVGADLNNDLSTSGGIAFHDVDLTDTHTTSVVADAGNTLGGTLTMGAVSESSGAGTVGWTYKVADHATDYLAAGQTVTEKFTITIADGHGGAVDQVVTIDVTGTNEAATIGDPSSASVTDNTNVDSYGNLVATGTILVSDPDHDQSSFQTAVTAADGDLGSLSLNADGSYTYTVANSAVEYLAAGESKIDTFTVTSLDGTTKDVSFTINGINDAPVFTGDAAGVAYAANGAAVAIATNVVASDIDSANYNGGTLTATVIAGGHEGDTLSVVNNGYISISGSIVMFDADGDSDPIAIGTLTHNGINSLTFTLNGNADDAAVAALAQAIEFSNSKPDAIAGTRTVAFTLHDGGGTDNGGHDSDYFTANVEVHAPVISTDQFTVTENHDGTTTVSGLYVSGADPSDTFTLAATTGAAPESIVTPSSAGPGATLAEINATLSHGIVYDPDPDARDGADQPDTDSVTVTVADNLGATDTVHFIFNQGGTGPDITLTGTSGKDVIFATGNNDTLTGGAGADQFVFRPSGNANSDTITDFSPGLDHIDLRAFYGTVDSSSLSSWLATHASVSPTNSADVLITLDANDAVTLKNVALNNLHVGDFIVSPHA
jgi:VCBS repeat-containing protein